MELGWYLSRQAGVISCGQAREAGLSQDTVDRRVANGWWERLHPGVYLAVDHPYTDEVRLRAAALWVGKDAVAHGVSAAWWHGLGPRLPDTVEVTVPRRRNPGRQPGVSVRRRDLPYPDLVGCATCGSPISHSPFSRRRSHSARTVLCYSTVHCNAGFVSLRCTGRIATAIMGCKGCTCRARSGFGRSGDRAFGRSGDRVAGAARGGRAGWTRAR
ncbi:MAG: type IV toxin-antitoxin system AbiEi family antitoxin domain-containing protein [Pseudonocardiaceae bacterium]